VFHKSHDYLSRRLQPARTCERNQRSRRTVTSRGPKPAARVRIIVALLMKHRTRTAERAAGGTCPDKVGNPHGDRDPSGVHKPRYHTTDTMLPETRRFVKHRSPGWMMHRGARGELRAASRSINYRNGMDIFLSSHCFQAVPMAVFVGLVRCSRAVAHRQSQARRHTRAFSGTACRTPPFHPPLSRGERGGLSGTQKRILL
jgi:hypothetical protein